MQPRRLALRSPTTFDASRFYVERGVDQLDPIGCCPCLDSRPVLLRDVSPAQLASHCDLRHFRIAEPLKNLCELHPGDDQPSVCRHGILEADERTRDVTAGDMVSAFERLPRAKRPRVCQLELKTRDGRDDAGAHISIPDSAG